MVTETTPRISDSEDNTKCSKKDSMGDARTSAPSSTTSRQDEPDVDTIKMFVGQVPRQWSEQECRELFEKYGPVHQLNVLRDKNTQGSKGCCFVTFYHRKDAIAAQAALHNIEVLQGMHHPVQMKPADSENRNERKLFVGMISKRLEEEDVKAMFQVFGHIEECTVLKDNDGRSKGCAFVTLSSRTCAQNAIKQMHHSQTMEGCNAPVVVKFADTARDKDCKKGPGTVSPALAQNNILGQLSAGQPQLGALQALAALLQPTSQQQPNVLSLLGNVLTGLSRLADGSTGSGGASAANAAGATPTSAASQSHQHQSEAAALFAQAQAQAQHQQHQLNNFTAVSQAGNHQLAFAQALAAQQHHQQQQQQQPPQLAMEQKQMFGYAAFAGAPAQQGGDISQLIAAQQHAVAAAAAAANRTASPNTANILHMLQQQQQQAPPKEASPVAALTASQPSIYSQLAGYGGLSQDYYQAITGQQAAALTSLAAAAPSANPGIVGNGQSKGPDGSNLFIYHLPQDFGDTDLVTTFSPFGQIVSAKVFIDKQTNLSKCFGFVSYDNALSAANAISAMNGFQIGSKRLKVQLKGGKHMPYDRPMNGTAAVSS